jgi:TonB family protein
VVEPKEPEINRNALFPGKRNQQSGSGSQGQSTGTGDQGKPNGSQNSNNYNGNGGNGTNYSLAGRTSVALPRPEYSSNNQGTVVVQIWVDRQGKVTRAEYQPKGSNTSDGYLVKQAISAARKARFNADAAAPDEQKGTITYIFKI